MTQIFLDIDTNDEDIQDLIVHTLSDHKMYDYHLPIYKEVKNHLATKVSSLDALQSSLNLCVQLFTGTCPPIDHVTFILNEGLKKYNVSTPMMVQEGLHLAAPDDTIWYMYSPLCVMFLPHVDIFEKVYERDCGLRKIRFVSARGVPYGALARLILFYIFSMAKKYGRKDIPLGSSLALFLKDIGKSSHTDVKATAREQFARIEDLIFHITDLSEQDGREEQVNIRVFERVITWDKKSLTKAKPSVVLSDEMFDLLTKSAVPASLNTLKSLSRSPFALDLYVFLTYRANRKGGFTVPIPVESLQRQFGATEGDKYKFTQNLKKSLALIKKTWPECDAEVIAGKLLINRTTPHIKPLPK